MHTRQGPCVKSGRLAPRRQSGAASDEDDQGLSKSGRELQKLLRGAASDSEGREGTPAPAAGTAAGAAEEGSESVYEDDDELDDAELDDDYLDRMVRPCLTLPHRGLRDRIDVVGCLPTVVLPRLSSTSRRCWRPVDSMEPCVDACAISSLRQCLYI